MNEPAVFRPAARGAGRIAPLSGDAGQLGETRGHGRLLLWPARALYAGPLLDHEPHAHHAIQITLALGDGGLTDVARERPSPQRAIVTPSDQRHRLACTTAVAQIYLDPESAAGRALTRDAALDDRAITAVVLAIRRWLAGRASASDLAALVDDAVTGPGDPGAGASIDPRVQAVLGRIHTTPGRHLALATLASGVALSPSRLGVLFRRDTGIPLRRYLLWVRLVDAVQALADGLTLTEAAHDAGFADSAHLSRTFRRMFGMPPSALHARHVEILSLDPGVIPGAQEIAATTGSPPHASRSGDPPGDVPRGSLGLRG